MQRYKIKRQKYNVESSRNEHLPFAIIWLSDFMLIIPTTITCYGLRVQVFEPLTLLFPFAICPLPSAFCLTFRSPPHGRKSAFFTNTGTWIYAHYRNAFRISKDILLICSKGIISNTNIPGCHNQNKVSIYFFGVT